MGAEKRLYLAYGSNLHPIRLSERVPSACLRTIVQIQGARLAFHMRGDDDSGKGNLVGVPGDECRAYGALYEIDPDDKPVLDRFEGAGYRDVEIDLTLGGMSCRCFTYLAAAPFIDESLLPFDWYKSLILLGARYLGLPDAYVRTIARTTCVADPDDERRRRHEALIGRMSRHDPRHETPLIAVDLGASIG